jgi:hypothetical protein
VGTTLTSLQGDGGVEIVWVAAIEGYDKVLTSSTNVTAVETAWAATDWTDAEHGLEVRGDFDQRITPWNPEITPNTIELVMHKSYDRTEAACFATTVHARGSASAETALAGAVDPNDDPIEVVTTTDFDASGTIYIGNERIAYDSKAGGGGTEFSTLTRGQYHPFSKSAGDPNRFGRYHDLPSLTFGTSAKPKVTDVKRYWVGSWVGVWAHRVVGDVIDTKANAQLVFAGTISSISDTSTGEVIVEVVEASDQIKRCTLFTDQLRGRAKDGIHLATNWVLDAKEAYVTMAPAAIANDADDLIVKPSGAAGDNEIDAGYYEPEEIIEKLNAWLNNEVSNNRLDAQWSIGLVETENGWRTRIVAQETSGTAFAVFTVQFYAPAALLHMLGYMQFAPNSLNQVRLEGTEVGTDKTIEFISDAEPLRSMLGQYNDNASFGRTCELESADGNWFNNRDYLPEPWRSDFTESGENWGIVELGTSNYALAKQVSRTEYTLYWDPRLKDLFGKKADYLDHGITITQGGYVELKQVVVLCGDIETIILSLLSSTGAANYNNQWDDFPYHLGAGIPDEIIGAEFKRSLSALSQATVADTTLIVLEKPTKLWSAIWSDLALRGAYLVWKNQEYRFVAPQMPQSGAAIHTLTEATKGSAVPSDKQRAVAKTTDRFLRNVLVVEYNRDVVGSSYRDKAEIINAASVSDYGSRRELTIKARNCYGAYVNTGTTVEAIASDLACRLMPLFGEPLNVVTRTVHMGYFEDVAPGDLVTITDSHMRDPATGLRGVTAKPAMILSCRHGWGGGGEDMFGEVDLLFLDVDRVTIYSPAALISSYAADTPIAGQSTITCAQNEFSETTDTLDDAEHFEAGDAVRIIQQDPASGSADTDIANVVSQSGNDIVLDDNLATLDFGNNTYYVVSDNYGDAAATQASDCYLADNADYLIEDTAPPYVYGDVSDTERWTSGDPTDLPERYHTAMYGDGIEHSVAYARQPAVNINNLISYKLAPQNPLSSTYQTSTTSDTWQARFSYPVHVPPAFTFGAPRAWYVAPQFSMSGADANPVGVRVTFSLGPPSGTSFAGVTFQPPFYTLEWTTTSTVYVIGAVQSCAPIYNSTTGVGFVTMEFRGNGAHGEFCEFRGLPVFYLGAVV